jgi:hypothetical protein
MRGWCIDPVQKIIDPVEISDDQDIKALIGYETIESDSIDDNNTIYFDEECFLRQSAGRFQIDKLIPVSGKAVILGKDADGTMTDVILSQNELNDRLTYLDN